MQTTLTINGTADPRAMYIGWTPLLCEVRLVDPTGATGPVAVTVRNANPAAGGQVIFVAASPGTAEDELAVTLPLNGAPVSFFVAGSFGRPSLADRDAAIEVRSAADGALLSSTALMVRVRKDANRLSSGERSRFVSAFATLNGAGAGGFSRFRDMHRDLSSDEAHGLAGFLPWHRAYLLDLERALQAIDPSVSMHYWRFDRPAPNVFARDFMGESDGVGIVRFSASNPIQFWQTDGQPGIRRQPRFNALLQPARVISEAATLRLGLPGHVYANFDDMEADPHGRAHTSFSGFIGSIDSAAKDPLFFMLHANADRLWAKWQWFFNRFDMTTATYPFLGAAGPTTPRLGHNLQDTMWPWNRSTVPPRPPTAPGGNFPAAAFVAAPGPTPRVGDMIDYQGRIDPARRLGFDYDDVPFEL